MSVRNEIGERTMAGRSPPLRRRRTKEYVPHCRTRQRGTTVNNTPNVDECMLYNDEDDNYVVHENNLHARYFDENSNTLLRSTPNTQLQDILRPASENSHLGERYQILRSENKILRERLQNALQREMKALKTFKRLAKENRQLKLNLRKYERTLLGLYDEESDSDHSEPPRDTDSRLRETLSQRQGCVDQFNNNNNNNNNKIEDDVFIQEDRCHRSSSTILSISRSTNTSTEDIREPLKIDRSTSTADLASFTDSDHENGSVANSSPESDAFKWTEPQSPTESYQNSPNLTDLSKVQFLQKQLETLESPSPQVRRTFSTVTHPYWTESLMLPNYLDVNELQRASSSPNLLDTDFKRNSQETSDSLRRVSDGSAPHQLGLPTRDFPVHLRPLSFHDDHMATVQEVTFQSHQEFEHSRRSGSLSSSSSSKGSQSQEDLASTSSSPVLVLRDDEDSGPQPRVSPRTSPLTIDVAIGPSQNKNLYVLDEVDSPQPSPQTSPALARRKIGHTVSLPAASFGHYMANTSQAEAIQEETVARPSKKKSFDDDQVYIKKRREPSVSLRFDGSIPKANAENLAADIAEFLQTRERSKRADLHPQERRSIEEVEPTEDAVISRAQSTRRRRGSAVVSLPGQTNYQMDLHVLGSSAERIELSAISDKKELSGSTTSLSSIDPEKRSRWSLLRRNKKMLLQGKTREEKGPKNAEDFKESLARLRDTPPRYFREHELTEYKDSHWTQLMVHIPDGSPRRPLSDGIFGASTISDQETKRREALWELFHSEVVYLTDHLLVLKEVFLDPLRKTQQEMYHLQSVDPDKIFCNLQDLCNVSTKFAKDLLLVFQSEQPTLQFGSTAAVVSAFTEFSSKVHPQYMRYCLNYSKALGYLDSLKKYEEFQYFIKWCESDPRCNRLQLTDLLVAPLQHLTKYPLLLKNIRKRTFEGDEQHNSLTPIIKSVEHSIKQLEGKVKALANYERLQELENSLVWPIITEIDPKTYVPEFLRPILAKQPRESLLSSPKRQLLYEGPLTLIENTKLDVYAFLFDDMLLLCKPRKVPQKTVKKMSLAGMYTPPSMSVNLESPPSTPPTVKRAPSGMQFTVYKQPIPLDRFIIIDFESTTSTGSTLKHSFTVIHYNRFKQTVGLYTLQVSSQNLKETWTNKLKGAQGRWSETVAMEMAAESVRLHSIPTLTPTVTETPVDSVPKSPDDGDMNQNQMLSYYKPIESHC